MHWFRRRRDEAAAATGRSAPRQLLPHRKLIAPLRISERVELPPPLVVRLAERRYERPVPLLIVMRPAAFVGALVRLLLLLLRRWDLPVAGRGDVGLVVVPLLVVTRAVVDVVGAAFVALLRGRRRGRELLQGRRGTLLEVHLQRRTRLELHALKDVDISQPLVNVFHLGVELVLRQVHRFINLIDLGLELGDFRLVVITAQLPRTLPRHASRIHHVWSIL
mmetsp:Transcript_9456/g.20556  ORF Transcript_9456/g.20556 Transcript_9456/m.20556 type:complete len:221 (+) Transcript_9456:545-1207(+)